MKRMSRLLVLKLRFIGFFHSKLFPGKYCWADCVSWAYGRKRWNPFRIDSSRGCKTESKEREHHACYCGGWKDGQCYDLMTKEQRQEYIDHANKVHEEKDDLPF